MTKQEFLKLLEGPILVRCNACVDTGVRDEGERFGICDCLDGLRERASGGNFLRLMNEARERREGARKASGPTNAPAVESSPVSIASTRFLGERGSE